MKKIMTESQHQILKSRQIVETVLGILKYRMGMESSLPRSPLGHFSHYIWVLLAYQYKRFLDYYSSYLKNKTPQNPTKIAIGCHI